ncbi:MAG: hypothetical protein JWR68_898 [Polaromonas sp.]|nr:hypothetical protein [Polaromonas sp.]
MARQLIVCCDGTNNNLTGRRNDTNVTQLCELLAPEAQEQRLYYDPGVGNPGELPGATWGDKLSRRYERLHGLVFGKGIYENIEEAYRFIMRNWQLGDEIYLFGFSRGAFTARSVGGLVTQFGILRAGMEGLVPTLLHIYFSDRQKGRQEYERIRAQIRALYCDQAGREAPVWFVGVWDTVASVGAPLLSREITASPTIAGKNFRHVRHALALDEYRRNFLPRPYAIETGYDYAQHGQSIRQEWFSGAHCDVGGGYANAQAGLSHQTLLWMVGEAAGCGLRLHPDVLDGAGRPDAALIAQRLDSQSDWHGARQKRVHSETYKSPLWALGGQAVRDPQDHGHFSRPVALPVESPTVGANGLAFPADTAWRQPRLRQPAREPSRPEEKTALNYLGHPALHLLLAALCGLFFWAVAGALLLGPAVIQGNTLWRQLAAMLGRLAQIHEANLNLAGWQLGWWTHCRLPADCMPTAVHPARALLADFGLIAAYGYLLAFAVSWAFARLAGLGRVGMGRRPWLNLLGMAACVAVLGDAAENLLTAALLFSSANAYLPGLPQMLGIGMSLAAWAKCIGLAGSAVLVVWACMSKGRAR